jgi:hypothetical protein
MIQRSFLLLLGLGVFCLPLYGQSSEGERPASPDTTTTSSTDADWLLLPFASYAPDTKFAGGIAAGYYRPEQPDGSASSVQTSLMVTQRRQLIAEVEPEVYLADGRWRAEGQVKASHFPNAFYGSGGDTPASAEEGYTERYVLLDLTTQRRIRPNLRVGPRLFLRGETVRDPDVGGLIDRGRIAGADGGMTAGIGLSAFWDRRNSLYYPTTGSYAEVVFTLHSATWGSDYTFGRLKTDLRAYRPVGPGILAGQLYAESVMGTAPFQQLPLLGGSSRMRGYREGRFRDDVYWTAQTEYRFPLVWRFKGTVFASVGEVGPRVGADLFQDVEAAVGIGGRLRLTDDGIHGRIDISYSPAGIEPYFSMGEAF